MGASLGVSNIRTFVNPEDDEHSFVLPPNLYVKIPGQTATTTATFVAKEPGIFTARCAIPAHSRSMVATVVVLPPPAVGEDGPATHVGTATSAHVCAADAAHVSAADVGSAHGRHWLPAV